MKVFLTILLAACLLLLNPCLGIASAVSSYQNATLVALSVDRINKKYSTVEPFGGVDMMTQSSRHVNVYHLTVELEGKRYCLVYEAKYSWSYVPRFAVGDVLQVRLEEKHGKMFLQRPDGKELSTRILRKE